MKTVLALIATLALAVSAAPPNIVVILADDLGWGDVQCNNPERGKIATPNIDRLAAQGMRFTDGHSSSGVCSPSRYTLLTGRYHWRTGRAGIVGQYGPPMIAEDCLTVPGLLKQHGYRTAAVGKWHLGWDWPATGKGKERKFDWAQPIRNGPTTRGFDTYFGTDVPNWPPFCFIENDRTVGIPAATLTPQQVGHNQASLNGPALPDWKLEDILPALADRACRVVTEATKRPEPFFLYMPLTSPHTPIAVSKDWKGKSGLNAYADFVMESDAAVGRVLDALDRCGAASNTLVLFTSDNGCAPYAGVEELEKAGHFPSGPFRGYKSDAWEGGHRIPFVVRWPGVVKPGAVCTQLVQQADLMATCADVLGAKLPATAGPDSFSLLPLLKGADGPVRTQAVNMSIQGLLALRSGPWKLICGPGSGGWSKAEQREAAQLYDLAADPGETRNLYDSEPVRAAALATELRAIVGNGRSTPGSDQPNDVKMAWRIP